LLTFHDGDGQIADGITVHCIGGHLRGLQAVRVQTQAGAMVLASDAAHYYENFMRAKPFPFVVDVQKMLDGFGRLHRLASRPELVVPGYDPLVRKVFGKGVAEHITRLDLGPIKEIVV
jgi:glyoxylase-like metal-dependent hydrolase (beta-lactamase superfamily II)